MLGTARCIAPGLADETRGPVPAPPNKRGRVMIIDDESALVRLVERVLGTHHEVVGFSGARRALAVLATGEHFDAILCDLMMPEIGRASCRERV